MNAVRSEPSGRLRDRLELAGLRGSAVAWSANTAGVAQFPGALSVSEISGSRRVETAAIL